MHFFHSFFSFCLHTSRVLKKRLPWRERERGELSERGRRTFEREEEEEREKDEERVIEMGARK